jgi:hypothetical protein
MRPLIVAVICPRRATALSTHRSSGLSARIAVRSLRRMISRTSTPGWPASRQGTQRPRAVKNAHDQVTINPILQPGSAALVSLRPSTRSSLTSKGRQ